MPSENDTSFLRKIRGSLKGAAALLVLDVMVGTFVFSLVVCPIWFFGAVLRAAFHPREWLASATRLVALARIALPLVTLAIVLGNTVLQTRMADANSQTIIRAVERYRAKNGVYPRKLDDLVPGYLGSVPRARYSLVGKFRYDASDTSGHLIWMQAFPVHCVYTFATARRSCFD